MVLACGVYLAALSLAPVAQTRVNSYYHKEKGNGNRRQFCMQGLQATGVPDCETVKKLSIFELFFCKKKYLPVGASGVLWTGGSVRDVCMSHQSDWIYYIKFPDPDTVQNAYQYSYLGLTSSFSMG